MRIAIIGTGRMGIALGRQFADAGHEVQLGSRDPARAREKALEIGAVFGGSYSEAVHEAEAVLLAVPWEAVPETLNLLGDFDDLILIDVTNPFEPGSVTDLLDLGTSGAEVIQMLAPEARVVKAWNYMYSGVLRRSPDFGGTTPSVLIAGDDPDAKRAVSGLVFDIGYDPVDAGALSSSRYLEPLAPLMTTLDRNSVGEAVHALKLLRRERVRTTRPGDDRARELILAGLSVDRPPA